jgi:integrase
VGSTIRRELGTLTKLLRLACRNKKLARVPILDKPKEGEARAGFFEPEQYTAVRRGLPADLQTAVAIGYTYGWRKSEILSLERRHLDLGAGTLRLDPGTTKNKDPRVVHLTPELKALLAQQLERVRAVERKTGRIIPYLFPHLSGRCRLGQRRRDFRKAWATACLKAGLATAVEEVRDGRRRIAKVTPHRVVHDLRRTAVRNMERAGVPRSVAMKLTGHRTENVYRRYAIVSDADLREAAAKLAAGTVLGTTAVAGVESRPQVRDIQRTGG